MNNFFKDKSRLFCFTPQVMLATFVIEFTLAFIIFVKYKLNPKTRVCIFTLLGLGIFQLCEYRICVDSAPVFWAYVGFVAITMLPAFGLDFITLADRDRKVWVPFGYVLSLIMIIFIFHFSLINNAICAGNYVIFRMNSASQTVFDIYYLGMVFLGICIAGRDYIYAKKSGTHLKAKLYFWILVGYISFLIPTGIVYLLSDKAEAALPSIMCGFAVGFSLIIFFKIVPALFVTLSHHAHHKHAQK